MILSYDAYTETIEEGEEKENRLSRMEYQMQILMETRREMFECLKYPEKLTQLSTQGK